MFLFLLSTSFFILHSYVLHLTRQSLLSLYVITSPRSHICILYIVYCIHIQYTGEEAVDEEAEAAVLAEERAIYISAGGGSSSSSGGGGRKRRRADADDEEEEEEEEGVVPVRQAGPAWQVEKMKFKGGPKQDHALTLTQQSKPKAQKVDLTPTPSAFQAPENAQKRPKSVPKADPRAFSRDALKNMTTSSSLLVSLYLHRSLSLGFMGLYIYIVVTSVSVSVEWCIRKPRSPSIYHILQ